MMRTSSNGNALVEDLGCLRVPSCSSPSRARSPSPAPRPPTHLSRRSSSSLMGSTGNALERRSLSTVAAIPPLLTEAPTLALLNAFELEWELESAMHVDGFTAFQCGAEFGFPEVGAEAPDLRVTPNTFQRVHSLGACLATPVDMDTGGREIDEHILGSGAKQVQGEAVQSTDRWSDWVRRIRRKRRLEHVQALLSMLARPSAIFKQDQPTPGPDEISVN